MKISAKEVASDVYSVSFDSTEIILQGSEVKNLLMQLMKVMTPGAINGVKVIDKADRRRTVFLEKISRAKDIGIQKLLLVGDHKDLLALLKYAEDDTALQQKFFTNMSENNAKSFNEDLAFEFREGLPASRRKDALDRLIKLTRQLELDGDLAYEKAGEG